MTWKDRVPEHIDEEIEDFFAGRTMPTGQIRLDVRDGKILSASTRRTILERRTATNGPRPGQLPGHIGDSAPASNVRPGQPGEQW